MSENFAKRASVDSEGYSSECAKWRKYYFYSSVISVPRPSFSDIYSKNPKVLNAISQKIQSVWDMKFTNGTMKR